MQFTHILFFILMLLFFCTVESQNQCGNCTSRLNPYCLPVSTPASLGCYEGVCPLNESCTATQIYLKYVFVGPVNSADVSNLNLFAANLHKHVRNSSYTQRFNEYLPRVLYITYNGTYYESNVTDRIAYVQSKGWSNPILTVFIYFYHLSSSFGGGHGTVKNNSLFYNVMALDTYTNVQNFTGRFSPAFITETLYVFCHELAEFVVSPTAQGYTLPPHPNCTADCVGMRSEIATACNCDEPIHGVQLSYWQLFNVTTRFPNTWSNQYNKCLNNLTVTTGFLTAYEIGGQNSCGGTSGSSFSIFTNFQTGVTRKKIGGKTYQQTFKPASRY